ncbi:MAG: hypothetical protein OXR68_01430 [Alphaproteobacteria bacterium]|nr:hypothetical protein [Alphaproteobacteria bacterium]MDD9919273.1 hypothetical protein [Alphaproteobacteria bacterium]
MNDVMDYQFDNTNHALCWSIEILRARRFPKIAAFYLEAEQGEYGHVAEFAGWRPFLPSNTDDRFSLAMKVASLLEEELDSKEQQLLQLYYWGDFADEARYRTAQKFQERMRQEGKRVRLSYRYSFRQLGLLLELSDKTVAKRVRQAQDKLSKKLEEMGLI